MEDYAFAYPLLIVVVYLSFSFLIYMLQVHGINAWEDKKCFIIFIEILLTLIAELFFNICYESIYSYGKLINQKAIVVVFDLQIVFLFIFAISYMSQFIITYISIMSELELHGNILERLQKMYNKWLALQLIFYVIYQITVVWCKNFDNCKTKTLMAHKIA